MTHYTAKELESLQLPGLPATESGIIRKTKREGWAYRERAGRGGGKEYPLSALPQEARLALAAAAPASALAPPPEEAAAAKVQHNVKQSAVHQHTEKALRRAATLPPAEKQRDADRRAILADLRAYTRASGLSQTAALYSYIDLYNSGRRLGMEAVKQRIVRIARRTIYHWQRQLKACGHLGANYRGNGRGNKIDSQPELRDYCVAFLAEYPHARPTQIEKGLRARYGKRADVSLPSLGRLMAWMDNYKAENAQIFCAANNPDGWKDGYMSAFGSASEQVTALNQLWEFDGTPADVMFADGRHVLTGAIDVYSRRPKILVTPTAKAVGVVSLLRRCLLDWGLPSEPWHLTAKTDNGSDYTANHIGRVVDLLGIEQVLCPPFSPWNKPHIERFFRSFAHDIVELLPGYIGHNVGDRKVIEDRKAFSERLFKKDQVVTINLTSAQFQEFADSWIRDIYMHREHASLGGQTPWQKVNSWSQPLRRIQDPRALDLLLCEAPSNNGLRTVGKKGIKLDHGYYIAAELWELIGKEVRVLYDPADLGRVHVYAGENFGEHFCVAECPERTGIDRAEVAAKAKALQNAAMAEARAHYKALRKKQNITNVVSEIMADAREKAAKITALPRPSQEYSTPALESAKRAVTTIHQQQQAPRPAADISTPEAQYLRWKKLAARLEQGETLYPEDERFYRGFAMTSDFKVLKQMEKDFGSKFLEAAAAK